MSFDYDPNEQAHISGADFAAMCDEMKHLRKRNKELQAELARLREQEPVAYWNGCILYTDPKPAQEIPSELIEWANSWQEDDSDMPSYLIGCNDMKHFVKSQLEKMKGKP
jgi:hypothetical protein